MLYRRKRLLGIALTCILLVGGVLCGCGGNETTVDSEEISAALQTASDALGGSTSYKIDGYLKITYTAEGLNSFAATIPYTAIAEFEPAPIFWSQLDLDDYAQAVGGTEGDWVMESYISGETQYTYWESAWVQAPVDAGLSLVEGGNMSPNELSNFFSAVTHTSGEKETASGYTEYVLTLDAEYLAEAYLGGASQKDDISGEMTLRIDAQTGMPALLFLHIAGTALAQEVDEVFGFELSWELNFSGYGDAFNLIIPQEALDAPEYEEAPPE